MKTLFLSLILLLPTAKADDVYEAIYGTGTYTATQQTEADKRVHALGREISEGGFMTLAEKSEEALDGIFKISILNLKRHGYRELAREIKKEWDERRGTLILLSLGLDEGYRPIGDFAPLSQWLAEVYERIEAALGLELCRLLRISDIKTLNYSLRVAFRPCFHGIIEFGYHMIHDDNYRGLLPVLTFWSVQITCSVATFGAGIIAFICSPIAMLCEAGMDRVVAPWLVPRLWILACE